MSDLSASDFTMIVRQIGLNPDDHDMDELRAAYFRLRELFVRLETKTPAHHAETLAVFDPTKRL